MTGRILIDLFTTLDGVSQAPGGPEEDPEGDFEFGGWQAPFVSETDGEQIIAGIRATDALLLGRKTYDIFAGYWPHELEGHDSEIARKFDGIPKYVASRHTPDLPWRDSHLLSRDLAAEIAALRERHAETHVIGSIDFARTLVADGLFDVLNLWVYPVVLGAGKRLFDPSGSPVGLELVEASAPTEKGAVLLRYRPTGKRPTTGDMSEPDRGA
ncbi:dihydrofolate reductase [Conyzicola lurida]|uniref:Dihydrofolate reductase n=1 Tax=Conyzicola lurida TaxID=1172621 RepID=A0A841AE83_9MICO|nr:dihydrofolate reductase [Conyzicola lurida]